MMGLGTEKKVQASQAKPPQAPFTATPNTRDRSALRAAALVLVLLTGLAVFRWHQFNEVPSGHDSAAHAESAIHLAKQLAETPTNLSFLRAPSITHMPLTYVVAQAFLRTFASPVTAFAFTMALLVLTTLLFAFAASANQARDEPLTYIPLFALVACPVFWETALSFNLEISVLLTASVATALFLSADKLSWRVTLPLGAVVLFLFSFSKMVVVLTLLPALLGWVMLNRSPARWKMGVLFLAVTAALALWSLPRLALLAPAVEAAAYFPQDKILTGPAFFGKVIAFDFLGLPILVALAALLMLRLWRRELEKTDLLFGVAFVLPVCIFATFKNQRSWFFLLPYIALACWLVFSLHRVRSRRVARALAGVVLAFYFSFGALNACSVLLPRYAASKAYLGAVEIPQPEPFSPMLTALADSISDEMTDDREVAAIISTIPGFNERRMHLAILMRNPSLALSQRLFVAERIPTDIEALIDNFARVTIFIRALDPNDQGIFATAGIPIDLLQGTPAGFVPTEMRAGLLPSPIVTFRRPGVSFPECDKCPAAEAIGFYESAQEHFAADRFARAAAMAGLAIRCNAEFVAARTVMCKSLVAAGRLPEAKEQIIRLFSYRDNYDQKMALVEFVSRQVTEKRLSPKFFFDTVDALAANPLSPEQRFALLGWRAHVEQALGRWSAAAATLDRQLRLSGVNERQGVILAKAYVLDKAGERKSAAALASSILKTTDLTQPFHAEAALLLVCIAVHDGEFTAARNYLELSVVGRFDERIVAETTVNLSKALAEAEKPEEALDVLAWAKGQLSGSAKAMVLIELGKRFLDLSQKENALMTFRAALAEGEIQHTWLLETIAAIEAVETH